MVDLSLYKEKEIVAMSKVTPFLMFEGNAEEAMNFYTSVIEDSKIINIIRYGANEAGKEGSVMQATFSLKGQEFMCIDSYIKHEFTFTPSLSRIADEIEDCGRRMKKYGNSPNELNMELSLIHI